MKMKDRKLKSLDQTKDDRIDVARLKEQLNINLLSDSLSFMRIISFISMRDKLKRERFEIPFTTFIVDFFVAYAFKK